jgi:hypothetical protein
LIGYRWSGRYKITTMIPMTIPMHMTIYF